MFAKAGVFVKAVHEHYGQLAASQTKEGKASMDDVNFTDLLDKFSKLVPADEVQILLVDGHDSHERHSVLSMARRNNIIIIRFPSHCTHLIQPLDLTYFGPFKAAYLNAMEAIMKAWDVTKKTITASEFVRAVKMATDEMAEKQVINSGFQAMGLTANEDGTGIVVDSQAIPEYKLIAAKRGNMEKQEALDDMIIDVDGIDIDLRNLSEEQSVAVEASRRYILKQGLTLPASKLFNYRNPVADELTADEFVANSEVRDQERDQRRKHSARKHLNHLANVVGANILIEGEEDGILLPKPVEGFVDVGVDSAMNLISNGADASKAVSLEKLIELVSDSEHYDFWMTLRNIWYRVSELEVTKKLKTKGNIASEVNCKYSNDSAKKLNRNDLKEEGYKRSWVIFNKSA